MEKTITVKSIRETHKGVILTTLGGEEYKYTTLELADILEKPGTVANITFDENKKITAAQKLAFLPDTVALAEKADAAKKKTAAIVNEPVKPPAPKQVNPINRSTSLSYAKDLVIAGIIKVQDLVKCAETFYLYTIGEETPEPLDLTTITRATKTLKEGV